jgi:hypothetical protein
MLCACCISWLSAPDLGSPRTSSERRTSPRHTPAWPRRARHWYLPAPAVRRALMRDARYRPADTRLHSLRIHYTVLRVARVPDLLTPSLCAARRHRPINATEPPRVRAGCRESAHSPPLWSQAHRRHRRPNVSTRFSGWAIINDGRCPVKACRGCTATVASAGSARKIAGWDGDG